VDGRAGPVSRFAARLAESRRRARGGGRCGGALDELRQALTITPRNGVIYYNIGNIMLGGGGRRQRAEAYAAAIRYAPDFAATYYYRAAAREQTGDLEGALRGL